MTGKIDFHLQKRSRRRKQIVLRGFTEWNLHRKLAWMHDRGQLWRHAERAEKGCDAQLSRGVEIALPHELVDEQRIWLVKDFAREAFAQKGCAVGKAVHAPD